MKKLLLPILSLFIFSFALAQEKRVGYSIDLTPFVGTWEYRTENELFKVMLVKGKIDNSLAMFDCILGGYYYQKDGQVIADYLSPIPAVSDFTINGGSKIIACAFSYDQSRIAEYAPDYLFVTYFDDKKEGKSSGEGSSITLLTYNTIKWELKEGERWIIKDRNGNYLEGHEPKPEGFSVPTNVVLTKVE